MALTASLLLLSLTAFIKLGRGKENFNYNFYQNDYHVILERGEVVSYNKQYVKFYSIATFKYNRSTTAINSSVSYKVDLGNNLELVTQMYKFASNEYRLFPLRIQLNFCRAISTDVGGARTGFMKCGNFLSCPLVKNKLYHVCYFTIDESKLPPYIPSGRFMAEVQGMYSSVEVFVIRAYVEIIRPLSWN